MKEPLVSIIVPIYNVEKHLKKCLDSVLSQTYRNTEIILIDDGSTDNSGHIADEYSRHNDNISVIHTNNGGLSRARNIGIKNASGDWISFIDSDDFVSRDFISKLLNSAIKNSADIATCKFRIINNSSKTSSSHDWPTKPLTGHETMEQTLINQWSTDVWHNIFKIKIFKDNGIIFPEGRKYESISTKIQALCHADKVSFINEELYFYIIREGSITHQPFDESVYASKLAAIKDLEESLSEETKETKSYLNHYVLCLLNSIFNDMAKWHSPFSIAAKPWRETRNNLLSYYQKAKFPSIRARICRTTLLLLSLSRPLYCLLYTLIIKFRDIKTLTIKLPEIKINHLNAEQRRNPQLNYIEATE